MSLATWNTQGTNATALILNQQAQNFPAPFTNLYPDFICIQEGGDAMYAGNLGPPVACAWNPAPSFAVYHPINNVLLNLETYNGYHVPWQASVNGNKRCSLAILWRAALGPHANMPINGWHDGIATHRPVFWVTPLAGRRQGCIHAPRGNMGYVTAALGQIAVGAPPAGWILAGDINISPRTVGPLPAGVSTMHTNGMTHQNGRNIDYLFYDGVAPFAICASAGAFVQSDHLQVRFI